jgi:hypothetical protein
MSSISLQLITAVTAKCGFASARISQAGKPVILCGAAIPEQFEQCVERRYFSNIHYLALVCNDKALSSRLRDRPKWRGSFKDEYIKEHIQFNNWLKSNAQNTQPQMTLLDTSEITTDETAKRVEKWASSHLNMSDLQIIM